MITRFLYLIGIGTLLLFAVLFLSNRAIEQAAKGRTYKDLSLVPQRSVAVVLGTSNKVFGRPNLFYTARIEAAIQLYTAGKVQHIIVSGDNSSKYYDEPSTMKKDLMAGGIPEVAITADYAGFRTLDSVVRANRVFGQNHFIVVSQCFHGERSIYLALHHNIDAIAFCAADVYGTASIKTYLREYLARFKAVLDVWVLRKEPRYLGDALELKGEQ